MVLIVVCKSPTCHSGCSLADSYIATSHKHFRSTVAISLLISYIETRSRCLRTADFSIEVHSDYIVTSSSLCQGLLYTGYKKKIMVQCRKFGFCLHFSDP